MAVVDASDHRGGGHNVEERYAFSDYLADVMLDEAIVGGDPDKLVKLLYDRLNTPPLGIAYPQFKAMAEADAPPTTVLVDRLKRLFPSREQFFGEAALRTQRAFGVHTAASAGKTADILCFLMKGRNLTPAALALKLGVLPESIEGMMDGSVLPDTDLVGGLARELQINKVQLLDAVTHDRKELTTKRSPVAAKLAMVLGSHRVQYNVAQLVTRLVGGEHKETILGQLGERGRAFVTEVMPRTDERHPQDRAVVDDMAQALGLEKGAAKLFRTVACGADFGTVLDESASCGIVHWKAFVQRLKDRLLMPSKVELARHLNVDEVTVGFWLEGKSFAPRESQANGGDSNTLHDLASHFLLNQEQIRELWFIAKGRAELGTQEEIVKNAKEAITHIYAAHQSDSDKTQARKKTALVGMKTFVTLMDRSGFPLQETADMSEVGYDAIRDMRGGKAQLVTLENAHRLSRLFYPAGSAQQKELAMVFLGYSGHRTRTEWIDDIKQRRISMGDAIRELRESKGQSREQFGGEALPSSTIRGWENGDIKKIENKDHVQTLVRLFGFKGDDVPVLERFLRGESPEKSDRMALLAQAEAGEITVGSMLKTLIREECQQSLEAFGASLDVEGRAGRKGISHGSLEKYTTDKERISKIPWAKAIAEKLGFSGDGVQRFIMLAMGRTFPNERLQALAEANGKEPLSMEARAAGLHALLDDQQLSMVQLKEEMRTQCEVPERTFKRFMKEGWIDSDFIVPFMRALGVPETQKATFVALFENPVMRGHDTTRVRQGDGSGDLPDH